MLRDLLLMVVALTTLGIASDIRDIKLSIHQTETKATTVQELFKYWFPPLKETRLANQCGRCHK